MSVNSAEFTRDQSNILLTALLGALGLVAVWFVFGKAWHYSDYSPAAYSEYYWGRRWGLIPHILGGVTAIIVGVVQLWLGLTGRAGLLHRTLGRVYATGVVVGSIGGYYMAFTIPASQLAYGAGLFMLSTAWIITTGSALLAIRRGQLTQHREWMIRSYIVTFAFVTFRLVANQIVSLRLASPDDAGLIMAWACWSVPLLLAEPLIQLSRSEHE